MNIPHTPVKQKNKQRDLQRIIHAYQMSLQHHLANVHALEGKIKARKAELYRLNHTIREVRDA